MVNLARGKYHSTLQRSTVHIIADGQMSLVHPIMIGIVWALLMMAVVEVTLWIISQYHEHKTLELLKEEEEEE